MSGVGVGVGRIPRDKQLELHLALEPAVPRQVRTDPRRLRQILINLVGNAVKFTLHGSVTLTISYRDRRLKAVVADTGPGIATADVARLFHPFEQLAPTRGRGEGSGLGLAISRGFARALGGDLSVNSAPGQGSAFTLEIPAIAVEHPHRPAMRHREVIGLLPGQTSPRVLVVDDDPDSQRLLHDLLATTGFAVHAVGDGAAAVATCAAWHPDLVWMDIDLPGMDGLAATAAIRAGPGPQPVILALTAAAFAEDRHRILAAGCQDVLLKPFRQEEIFSAIEIHLRVHFAWRERQRPEPPAQDALLASALAALSDAERQRLRQAVITGDLEAIAAAAQDWSDRNAAAAMQTLVASFQLDRITALVQP